jgi:bacteriorhodopsin
MPLPHALAFASDATWAGIAGGTLLVLAVLTGLGERRRRRRTQIDAVGCMPWTTLSVMAFMTAMVLLAMAAEGWLRG